MKIRIYLVLLFLFVSSVSMAEETGFIEGHKNLLDKEMIKIEEVVVTASRIEEPLEETTSSVVVIRGEEIKKRNVAFVADLFRELPEGLVVFIA